MNVFLSVLRIAFQSNVEISREKSMALRKTSYFQVFDGPDTNSPLLGRWCGSDGPNKLASSGNSVTLVFKSDASYNEGGFILDYSTGNFT